MVASETVAVAGDAVVVAFALVVVTLAGASAGCVQPQSGSSNSAASAMSRFMGELLFYVVVVNRARCFYAKTRAKSTGDGRAELAFERVGVYDLGTLTAAEAATCQRPLRLMNVSMKL